MGIGIILLAAGSSSRMGQSKQLITINDEPLLLRSVKTALQSDVNNVIVVLGSNEEAHKNLIQHLPIEIVYNQEWVRGMGNSVKAGMNKLLLIDPTADAALVMVCDQPLLTAHHLKSILTKFSETKNPIIASRYAGTIGTPVLFERSIFNKLLGIDDAHGAKKIIEQNERVITLDFEDGSVDLDTPEDYSNYLRFRTNQGLL